MILVVIVPVIVSCVVMIVCDFAAIRLAIDLHDHAWIRAFFV